MKTTGDKRDCGLRHPARQTGQAVVKDAAIAGGAERPDLVDAVDFLMTGWCKRGALQPLQVLLRAYPGPLWHVYHKMELLESLEILRSSQGELTPEELQIISELLDLLKGRLAAPETSAKAGRSSAQSKRP